MPGEFRVLAALAKSSFSAPELDGIQPSLTPNQGIQHPLIHRHLHACGVQL